MYISLNWLRNFIQVDIDDLDKFLETLTLGGFEVEDVESTDIFGKSDMVFDISTTANRSDTTSILGFSFEISTLFNKNLINSNFNKTLTSNFSNLSCHDSYINSSFKNCSFFYGIKLDNIEIKESPPWLKRRLLASKITPVDNITDISNYMILEFGQPIFIYDFEKIQGLSKTDFPKIEVSYPNEDNTLIKLNDKDFNLNSKNLVVSANGYPISIAGIVTSSETQISSSTSSIFVECSIFPSEIIRQSSKACNLRTDVANSFIRGVNPTYFPFAFKRVLTLLATLSGSTFSFLQPVIYNQNFLPESKFIKVNYENVIKILGPIKSTNKQSFLDKQVISSYFKQLDFNIKTFFESKEFDSDTYWEIQVPSTRVHDLEEEIDVIEEIGRIHGFNNFVSSVPYPKKLGTICNIELLKRHLKTSLISLGLFECVHYSLISNSNSNLETLLNPFSKDQSALRPNLLNGLLKSSIRNSDQISVPFSAFEFGRVFIKNKNSRVFEHELMAGIFGANKYRNNWSLSSEYETWYEAKAKINELFSALNISLNWSKITETLSTSSFFHPRRTALVSSNGTKFGLFGQINPQISNTYNISSEIYLFEFDLKNIHSEFNLNLINKFEKYSFYPAIVRDLTFIFKKSIEYNQIVNKIYENGGPFLNSVILSDTYDNKDETLINLTFKLEFQSSSKTLLADEVNIVMKEIESCLHDSF